MDYDLNTKEGMNDAIKWTNATLGRLKDGGVWFVPRSGTTVTVHDGVARQYSIVSERPDPSLVSVLSAAGWTCRTAVINTIGEQHE